MFVHSLKQHYLLQALPGPQFNTSMWILSFKKNFKEFLLEGFDHLELVFFRNTWGTALILSVKGISFFRLCYCYYYLIPQVSPLLILCNREHFFPSEYLPQCEVTCLFWGLLVYACLCCYIASSTKTHYGTQYTMVPSKPLINNLNSLKV